MNAAWWMNTAWMWSCRREAEAFRRATFAPADAQWNVLREILRTNAQTAFGRHHDFERIRNREDFRQRVPLADYDDFAKLIERTAAGESNLLTSEPVRLFEPTSGTTSGRKLIPYTAGLQRQYRRLIAPWMWDLFRGRPDIRGGRAYWSISPAVITQERTTAGIPIGFDDDTAYLGSLGRHLAARVMAVPSEVARIPEPEAFRDRTLLHLLAAADLSLISVWSPTFLTGLIERFEARGKRLLSSQSIVCGQRCRQIVEVMRSSDSWPAKLKRLWPRLSIVSCWADAAAAQYVPALRQLFPSVEIQPKGLLATEGAVSFPLLGRPGAALALRSHFFEFEEMDGDTPRSGHSCRFADELEIGKRYAVLLTTAGGLYRYRLLDVVEVVGFENQCPLLAFRGRIGGVSDLVGEKLSEAHVSKVLSASFSEIGLAPQFALMVPVMAKPPHYRLYFQGGKNDLPGTDDCRLLRTIEAGLSTNPYYRQALQLGQLEPLDLRRIRSSGESGWSAYERRLTAGGRKLGNVKPVALDARAGWPDCFDPLTEARWT